MQVKHRHTHECLYISDESTLLHIVILTCPWQYAGGTLLSGSIGILPIPTLRAPDVEEHLVRVEQLLRVRVEGEHQLWVPGGVAHQELGGLRQVAVSRYHDAAIG